MLSQLESKKSVNGWTIPWMAGPWISSHLLWRHGSLFQPLQAASRGVTKKISLFPVQFFISGNHHHSNSVQKCILPFHPLVTYHKNRQFLYWAIEHKMTYVVSDDIDKVILCSIAQECTYSFNFSSTVWRIRLLFPFFWMKILRHREVKQCTQGHAACLSVQHPHSWTPWPGASVSQCGVTSSTVSCQMLYLKYWPSLPILRVHAPH